MELKEKPVSVHFREHVRWHEEQGAMGSLIVDGHLDEYLLFSVLVIVSYIKTKTFFGQTAHFRHKVIVLDDDEGIDPSELTLQMALLWLEEFKKLPEEKPGDD